MKKSTLNQLIKKGLSMRQMGEELECSQTTIKYWLNKHNLKTVHKQFNKKDVKPLCRKCGTTKESEFYRSKYICKICSNKRVAELQRANRKRAREFLGNKCACCGFDKYKCALDFHHLDPNKKDPNFNSMGGWAWERTLEEIKKCILLCKNCHIALHCGLIEWAADAIG